MRTPGNITYFYDAGGRKVRKEVTGGTIRDYIDGIEYSSSGIEFITTEEGRAIPNGAAAYSYQYYIKDHLGNTRAMIDQSGAITQVQDYYAFGLEMNPGNSYSAGQDNRYKYNGKEKQDETGQYDYGARFYDPVIGRWTSVDPLAEGTRRWSPYHYGLDNPIRFVDPDGMSAASHNNEYKVVIRDGQIQSTTMTGTRGGNDRDYITIVNMDRVPFGDGVTNFEVAVRGEADSGPGTDYDAAQRRNPTPGFRKFHGSVPTDLQAYAVLTLGLWGRGAAILRGAGAFAPEAGVYLPEALAKVGGSGSAKVFFGWGQGTTVTKTAADFTKKQLLEAGYTKEILHDIYSGLVSAGQKTLTAGKSEALNPASVARARQILQILKTHF